MKSKPIAVALVVLGVGATLAGLYGQVFLVEDEGHHDGRAFTFATSDVSATDELIVESSGAGQVDIGVERAGQTITDFDDLHGAVGHIFAVTDTLDAYVHVPVDALPATSVVVPAGDVRVVLQSAPGGGPDLLELGTTVSIAGERAPMEIATDDEWTNGDLTISRQGFDFVLSEAWNGDDVFGGPALLTLFRADDLAFVHAHAAVSDGRRFSFATDLPGLGDYLAAVEFEQDDALVTALFRFTL